MWEVEEPGRSNHLVMMTSEICDLQKRQSEVLQVAGKKGQAKICCESLFLAKGVEYTKGYFEIVPHVVSYS